MEHVKISMTPKASLSICHVTQNDNGREVSIDFEDYTLTGAENVSLIIRKPDGTRVETALENTASNFVIWSSVPSECDVVGLANCEIKAEDDGVVLYSASFNMNIEADPYGSDVTTLTVTGNPCTFDTDLADTLVSLTADIVCGGGGGTPSTPIPLVGHSELNLANVDDTTAQFWSADKGFDGVVDFNQLATGFVTQTVDDLTVTNNNDGSITVNGTASANGDMNITSYIHFLSTHKYLINGYKKVGSNNGSFSFSGVGTDSGNGNIWNNDLGDINLLLRFAYSSGDTFNNVVMYPQIYDLTQMFGASIADYIYTLEQGQAGAGVSFFKHFYPDDYYAYNVGETQTLVQMPYTVAFGQTVYGGVYDKSGRLTITWAGVDMGSLTWQVIEYQGISYKVSNSLASTIKAPTASSETANIKCSIFKNVSRDELDNYNYVICIDPNKNIDIIDNDYSTASDFTTAMSGAILAYELATPIVIDVPSISVFAENGTNNIVSDCLGDVSVTYIKKV